MRWFVVAICLILLTLRVNGASFYDQRQRGFHYLEEMPKSLEEEEKKLEEAEEYKKLYLNEQREITDPEEAKRIIEKRKKILDDKRALAEANPDKPKYLAEYMAEEEIMMQELTLYNETFKKARYLYPKIFKAEIDSAVVAKLKREEEEEKSLERISEFAMGYDLFVIVKSGCLACQRFKPILQAFGRRFNFRVSAIAVDGIDDDIFPTINDSNSRALVQMLDLKSVPVLFAISKKGDDIVPIASGLKTQDILIETIKMSLDYRHLEENQDKESFIQKRLGGL